MVLEADLPAAELVEAIQNHGAAAGGPGVWGWQPPPALAALFDPRQPPSLRAVRLGHLVIVSPAAPHAAPGALPAVEVRLGPEGPPLRQLSPRQAQVLQGLADGLTTKEIALQLGLHGRTVELHIAAIKRRFGTSSRMQSVLRGVALGLCKVRREPK